MMTGRKRPTKEDEIARMERLMPDAGMRMLYRKVEALQYDLREIAEALRHITSQFPAPETAPELKALLEGRR